MQCFSLMIRGVFIQKKKKGKTKIIAGNKPPRLVKVHYKEVGVLEIQLQHSKTVAK